MRTHIWAVLWKQLKDMMKNKETLIQFLMFPFMTVIMEHAINIPDIPEHFFANLFAIMYVGMAPLTCAAAIIAEEKEKNTLRVLQMCNVNAMEYLIGNAIYIIFVCMTGSLVIGLAGGYAGTELLYFMLIMLAGHCCSFLLGATIGVASKNQMAATSITVPVMMVLSFLPMLSLFNKTIGKVAKFIFSEQLYMLVNNLGSIEFTMENGIILSCNIVVIIMLFFVTYKSVFMKR